MKEIYCYKRSKTLVYGRWMKYAKFEYHSDKEAEKNSEVNFPKNVLQLIGLRAQ